MREVTPAGFFVLRTARLPLAAWTTDEAALRGLLEDDAALREALRDASPSLLAAVERCGADPWPRKVHRGVARYVARAAGRATPFGVLAAASVGTVAARTALAVDEEVRPVPVPTTDGRPRATPLRRAVGAFWHVAQPEGGWSRVRRTAAIDAALADPRADAVGLGPQAEAFVEGLTEVGLLVGADGGDRAGRAWDGRRAAPALTLGDDDVAALAEAAALLARLTPDEPPAALADFARRFTARYGDAEVPVLEAVDPESGVGLRDVTPAPPWDAAAQRRLDLLAGGADEVELTDDDVDALTAARSVRLPPAFTVVASLAADGSLWVRGVDVAGGARLLGRHAVGDTALTAALRGLAALEPDAIEVRPGGPLGVAPRVWPAVLDGPESRPPDPPAPDGAEPGLDPAELTVSVADGQVVLRHGDRGVVPRWSCAADLTTHPCDPLRLLGLLAAPGPSWLAWSWGPLAPAARLPRVRRGRLVLAPGLVRRVGDTGPFAFAHVDGTLPVRRPDPLLLPPPPAEITVTEAPEPHGAYVHELLVPFRGPPAPPRAVPRARPLRRDARHDPGGPWTSVHVGCGPAEADDLLHDVIAPWCGDRPWWFLRYDDPEWHLRVRVRTGPERLTALLDGELRASVHPYLPEHHRYGGAREDLHVADTQAVMALLASRPSHAERLAFAVAGVRQLLADVEHPDPRGLARRQRDLYVAEQGLAPRPAAAWSRTRRPHDAAPFAARTIAVRAADPPLDDRALTSLAHLHVNRLLRAGHRVHEAFVWDAVAATA